MGYSIAGYTVIGMDIIANKACGACLAGLRKSAGLRQLDLAARLGAPQSFVSKIETGERSLKAYEQFAYAEALGMGIHDFVSSLQSALQNAHVR